MVKIFFFMFILMPFQYATFHPDSLVYRELVILFFSTTHFHIPFLQTLSMFKFYPPYNKLTS